MFSFGLKKQTSKNVAGTTFKERNEGTKQGEHNKVTNHR